MSLRLFPFLASALLVAASGCCTDHQAHVSDMRGRLKYGFDFAVHVKFDFSMRIDFQFDLGAWAKVFAATAQSFSYDLQGRQAYSQTVQTDIDDDGVIETVRLVAFAGTATEGGAIQPERVFAAWEGDTYTFDQGRCYLLSWQGSSVEVLNAQCGANEPALHCTMAAQASETNALTCDVCNATGTCADCSSESVSDCVREGEQRIASSGHEAGAGGSGPVEAGSEASGTGGAGGAAGAMPGEGGLGGSLTEGGGSPGAGGAGASVSVEFNSCVEQTKSLQGSANGCSRGALRDTSVLCGQQLSTVNLCYLAVQGAGLFSSTCSILNSDVCGGIFP